MFSKGFDICKYQMELSAFSPLKPAPTLKKIISANTSIVGDWGGYWRIVGRMGCVLFLFFKHLQKDP